MCFLLMFIPQWRAGTGLGCAGADCKKLSFEVAYIDNPDLRTQQVTSVALSDARCYFSHGIIYSLCAAKRSNEQEKNNAPQ